MLIQNLVCMFIIIKRETSKQRFKRLRLRQQAGLLLDESEASQLAQKDEAKKVDVLGDDEDSADGKDSAFCTGMGTLLVPTNRFDTLGNVDALDTQNTTAAVGDEIKFDFFKVDDTDPVNVTESTSSVEGDGGDVVNDTESTSTSKADRDVGDVVNDTESTSMSKADRDVGDVVNNTESTALAEPDGEGGDVANGTESTSAAKANGDGDGGDLVNDTESTALAKADGEGGDVVKAAESTSSAKADGGSGVVASRAHRKRKACYVLVNRDPKLQQARLHVRDE